MNHIGWVASLSNGETVKEQPAAQGELSSWQKLLQRLGNLRITQLQVRRGGVVLTSVPKAEGYFQGYEMRISNHNRRQKRFQGCGSIFDGFIFINWVDDNGNVWQDVRPVNDLWIHTDKRSQVDI